MKWSGSKVSMASMVTGCILGLFFTFLFECDNKFQMAVVILLSVITSSVLGIEKHIIDRNNEDKP